MKITKCMCCMEDLAEDSKICSHCGFNEEETPALPHQLPYGSVLNGTYMVGKALGEGGFGITYIGWDLNLGIKVAIKEFYPEGFVGRDGSQSYTVRSYQGDSTVFFNEGKDKFLEEARSLGKFMQLDGIVSVKDFFLENNTVYIVMEYLEGISLKTFAKENGGKVDADKLLEIMKPVIEALMEVHKNGIIHRDISPDNIMICKDGKVKLIDFGAAREASPEGEKTLSVMLKKGYSPEEQYRTHGEQGTWTDVYALSATIYAMLTGIKPDEPLDRLENDTLAPLSKMGVRLKKRQEDVLLKGLEIKASDRVQTMEELYRGLYKDGKENEFAIKKKKKRNKAILLVAAMCVIALCVGVAVKQFMPQKLNTALWVDAQVGQNITSEELAEYLPSTATDVVFSLDGTVTGNLLISSMPESGDTYELEVQYKQDGKDYIQQLNIVVKSPTLSTNVEKVVLESGNVVEEPGQYFVAENVDFLQVEVRDNTNSQTAGVQPIEGYILNGEYIVNQTALVVDYYNLDEEEQAFCELVKTVAPDVTLNKDLEKCADVLIEKAVSMDMSTAWEDILTKSTKSVKNKYPEVSYDGAFLYPFYRDGASLQYSAEEFFHLLMGNEELSAMLKEVTDISVEARTVTGETQEAVYWCLFYRR